MNIKTKLGFTLIEILVVVLIIGILGAIALPQYQRALLKSRYAALMPIAKSMANSNEAYYLEHGIYADDPQDLLIQGQSRYTDDTELEFGTVSDYAYVLAKNEDKIPNNTFVVYQKHSGEFPGEIHCEALADNDLAESVCKSFGGNESIGKTLTDGYETYVLFGTGNGVAPTGDNGGDEPEEPEEPQTPTCEGAAPTKQEACSSGCGSVTVTAECEEGEWVYPTADMSSCPVKPNDETVECPTGCGSVTVTAVCEESAWVYPTANTSSCPAKPNDKTVKCPAGCGSVTVTAVCEEDAWIYPTANTSSCPAKPNDQTVSCDTGFTGNKTRTATCNSAGTAWEFTDNWNTSGCTAVPTCPGTPAATVTASTSGATGSNPTCVDGQWVYTWSGGQIYANDWAECSGSSAYACAGSTFRGWGSYCNGYRANGCAGSTFSGEKSYCKGQTANGCAGTTIQAGAYCRAYSSGGCDGAKYGADPTGQRKGIGSCYDNYGYCPTGVPINNLSWNDTNGSYDYTWKGNCCNPAYMVSGECPSGIAICQ